MPRPCDSSKHEAAGILTLAAFSPQDRLTSGPSDLDQPPPGDRLEDQRGLFEGFHSLPVGLEERREKFTLAYDKHLLFDAHGPGHLFRIQFQQFCQCAHVLIR